MGHSEDTSKMIDTSRGCFQRIDHKGLQRASQERVKELECLYGISKLIERHGDSLATLLQGIVELLPPAWQYPEECCARLALRDQVFTTTSFGESSWIISAPLIVQSHPVGKVEVFYRRRPPQSVKDVFLKDEHTLLAAVAERVGKMIERIWTEQLLQAERVALQEANVAMREVLARIDDEKQSIYADVTENVQKVLMPVLNALEKEIPRQQRMYTALLRKHLEEIFSPFAKALSGNHGMLTPSEIQVCDLIHNGYSSKEIAEFRGVCLATVNKQREHIRKKLALHGTGKNLASHLSKFS
jgi:DNA-binding CsgD family transcriptional regulator